MAATTGLTAAMRLGVAFAADASTDAGAELARANEPCMPPALARAAQDPAGVVAGTVSRSLLVIVARAGASVDSLESAFESAGVFRDAKPPLLKVGDPARDAAADAARRLRLHRSRCTSFSSAKISAHSSLVTRSLSNAQKTPPGVLRRTPSRVICPPSPSMRYTWMAMSLASTTPMQSSARRIKDSLGSPRSPQRSRAALATLMPRPSSFFTRTFFMGGETMCERLNPARGAGVLCAGMFAERVERTGRSSSPPRPAATDATAASAAAAAARPPSTCAARAARRARAAARASSVGLSPLSISWIG